VAGAGEIHISEKDGQFTAGDVTVKEGDWLTLDGAKGEVYSGELKLVEPEMTSDFKELMSWADSVRKLKVRTNADKPEDVKVAREFGAEGIGLTRTEHMFFEGERIRAVREMIVAKDVEARKKALAKLEPMQKEDFKGIFKEMDGFPVTIRLLDPPLHEFLPKEEKDIEAISKELGISAGELKKKVEFLHEFNPMLGHRGCRLGVTYPEITEMQSRAIFEAALECQKEGIKVFPEIEIPLVGEVNELKNQREIVERIAEETGAKGKLKYKIGTMIELPRACLTADEIAKEADFFSFGTNDLTQTTFGFSRDDVGKFVPEYIEKGIFKEDPFNVIDREGVGSLMKQCIELGRKTKKDLEIGICGEHGGEPNSVEFCHQIGLDYVSCSPFRVPIARLAAAQAVLKEKK
ncbi:MAG: putative PEP-binding protein, partial [Candidatus Diapherotrites archaeon]